MSQFSVDNKWKRYQEALMFCPYISSSEEGQKWIANYWHQLDNSKDEDCVNDLYL